MVSTGRELQIPDANDEWWIHIQGDAIFGNSIKNLCVSYFENKKVNVADCISNMHNPAFVETFWKSSEIQ